MELIKLHPELLKAPDDLVARMADDLADLRKEVLAGDLVGYQIVAARADHIVQWISAGAIIHGMNEAHENFIEQNKLTRPSDIQLLKYAPEVVQ